MGLDTPDEMAAGLDAAEAVLRGGGTVVLPTDTVYGLAALASVPGATAQLFALKDRQADHPLAVLVADVDQALTLCATPASSRVREWMGVLWPGPLTIVLERSDAARDLELGAGPDTIGLRCPQHRFVRDLAARVGPLATTSANRSGQLTPVDARSAAASLAGPVGLVIDGGPAGTVASTVVDATTDPLRILRLGAVAAAALGLDPTAESTVG